MVGAAPLDPVRHLTREDRIEFFRRHPRTLQSATALKPGRCGQYENRVDLAIGTNLEQERDVEDDERNPPARGCRQETYRRTPRERMEDSLEPA